ncbi:MAG: hypothetical protein ACUZ8E_03080 [Candidatus Anammoxibacter sp.]
MESINNFKSRPVTVGLMLWMFGGIAGIIIAASTYVLNDLKADIFNEGEARKEWVLHEFKPHVTNFNTHVKEFNKISVNVGIVVDRTNSMKSRTQTFGTHSIELIKPEN